MHSELKTNFYKKENNKSPSPPPTFGLLLYLALTNYTKYSIHTVITVQF